MKFLVPNYSCLQNPWLGGYRPQIPVISVLCPQLNLLNPPLPEKNSWVRHWFFTSDTPRCVTARAWMHIRISTTQALPSRNSRITEHVTGILGTAVRNISAVVPWLEPRGLHLFAVLRKGFAADGNVKQCVTSWLQAYYTDHFYVRTQAVLAYGVLNF